MMRPQQVYVITSEGGPTKIGISQDPTQRRATLQSEVERLLTVAHVADIDGLKARAVEKKAHELLQAVRVHGEWFDVGLVEAVEAINLAIKTVRDASFVEDREGGNATMVRWHLRIAVEEDVKRRIEELAEADCRSPTNYIGRLVELHCRKEPS